MRRVCFLLLLIVVSTPGGMATAQERPKRSESTNVQSGRATLESYESRMDGRRRPYGVCATNKSDRPKPLIVHLQPGLSETVDDASRAFRQIVRVIDIARAHDQECIAIRPTGRGPGSVFQNYGEVDALEAIEDVCSKYAVDRSRITLFGHSMGGAGVFYMVSHYPDRFAGAVPMAGYCDYRLWRKPGGYTFHMAPWEEPSWRARSAALLVDNFQHTPLWMMHGAWDRAVGGGVSAEHSRQMHARLIENGFQSRYTEVAQKGHGFLDDELLESAVLWLLDQARTEHPAHVRLSTGTLRHNTSYWVAIDQMRHYGKNAQIDARIMNSGDVHVSTTNVQSFSLGPIRGARQADVVVAQKRLSDVDLTQKQAFELTDLSEEWVRSQKPTGGQRQKQYGCSGPIGDLFFDDVILVSGTTGSEAENNFTRMAAYNTRSLFRRTNGGVHRGGIQGENSVMLPYQLDTEISDEDIRGNNLLLFGTPKTNRIMKRFADQLPLKFGNDSLTLGNTVYRGDRLAVFAIFPHPENRGRYVAVHGGVTEDSTTFGSHLNVLLLPDFVIYDGPQMVDWGFFDNHWRPVSHDDRVLPESGAEP